MRLYDFTVMGRISANNTFPVDMLRYDACWPQDGDSAFWIGARPEKPVTKELRFCSTRPPTVDRWRSFGWGCKLDGER